MSGYIRTASGLQFWPAAPRPEHVQLRDIAHALANLCRYTGHTREFYSVAQHSVIVAEHLLHRSVLLAQYGLLHDASEAYLCDVARPVKRLPAMDGYRELEAKVQAACYVAFGLGTEAPPEVKAVDTLVLHAETRDLMTGSSPAHAALAGDHARVVPLPPAQAKALFLEWAAKLGIDEVAA